MPSEARLDLPRLAAELGLSETDVEPYGWWKGKLELDLLSQIGGREPGRLINVTAVNPTPFGEGKTVISIGLAMALNRRGRRAVATLREPSMGPVFGIKGGGAGGGRCTLFPQDEINLHFTGDLHAVTSANNLLAALVENHAARGLDPQLDPQSITWQRVLDVNDKALAHIVTGLGNPRQAQIRETGFRLTAASELMSVLALSSDLDDLRCRIDRMVLGRDAEGNEINVQQLHYGGAVTALLRDALRPNLVQTCEGTPALVHTGPFANIAHGNSSIIADRLGLALADDVVTESGFGADCGAEKFINIKCRQARIAPAVEVLVCTLRAIKYHSGQFSVTPGKALPAELSQPDRARLERGLVNLEAHIDILKSFDLPVVVAVNRFPDDTDEELSFLCREAIDRGANAAVVADGFARGSEGMLDLADCVNTFPRAEQPPRWTYADEASLTDKLSAVARQISGADGVSLSRGAERQLEAWQRQGYGNLGVCIAKTPYSLSHDSRQLGRPTGFTMPIDDVFLCAGAGFVYALSGAISTMPGLPREPAARRIDLDSQGQITGMK